MAKKYELTKKWKIDRIDKGYDLAMQVEIRSRIKHFAPIILPESERPLKKPEKLREQIDPDYKEGVERIMKGHEVTFHGGAIPIRKSIEGRVIKRDTVRLDSSEMTVIRGKEVNKERYINEVVRGEDYYTLIGSGKILRKRRK